MKKKLLASLILAVLAGGGLMASLRPNVGPVTASSSQPATRQGEREFQGLGYIEPEEEVRRLVFRADGVIQKCNVKIGDKVKAGDILMVLHAGPAEAEIEVARVRVGEAKASRTKILSGSHADEIAAAECRVTEYTEKLRYAKDEHVRLRSVGGVTSEHELKAAETNEIQAKAGLAQAEAVVRNLKSIVRDEDRTLADQRVAVAESQLRLAEERLAERNLTAPRDGEVLEIIKREGESARMIDPEPILVLGDTSHLQIRAEIDERFVADIRTGQHVEITGRGLGGHYTGTVTSVRHIMGKKTVFAHTATERLDLDIIQVIIKPEIPIAAPVGLEVTVRILVPSVQ